MHDIVTVEASSALVGGQPIPDWVYEAVDRTKRVVVRRAPVKNGLLPIGVRGELRHQRYAAYLLLSSVTDVQTPIQLAEQARWKSISRKDALVAFSVLEQIASYCNKAGIRWGPTGSIGFELASGCETAHAGSDIDIAIYAERPVERQTAENWMRFHQRLPVRIDALLETPAGACSFIEYARSERRILLRTQAGPRLVRCPWNPDD